MHPYYHAQATPEKAAIVMAQSGQTISYRELEDRSNRFAQLLRARGIHSGDRIAILLENHPRFFEVALGAQRAGVVYTAISTRLTAEEVRYILTDCEARLFLTSKSFDGLANTLFSEAHLVKDWLMIDGTVIGYQSYESELARCDPRRIADETAGGAMLYSSGTTGRPKGVYVPPVSTEIDAPTFLLEVNRKIFGVGRDTVYLSPAPLYHAAPLRFCMTVMALGGTCVIMENFDAQQFLDCVERYRITHTQVVPTMFVRMLKLPDAVRGKFDLSSLSFAIHAAAPCPISIKERMIAWWGPIIWEYYAGTEGNGMTIVATPDWLSHKGTVGRAVVGQVKICDEQGEELPPGKIGMVYFAEGRPFIYHNDPAKTASSRNAKGWTTLGDVGYLDQEGYLYLTDRIANMIISGGVNIYPQETENLLVTHPKVLDVAVFGIPNEEFGEEVKAVVQLRDPSQAGPELERELIVFCREHLSPIKCPRSVDFQRELPRLPTGKLLKRLLREPYWAGRGSQIV